MVASPPPALNIRMARKDLPSLNLPMKAAGKSKGLIGPERERFLGYLGEVESVSCSFMSNSFATPWAVAHQAPLSMGFSRQEYWSE